MTSATSGLGYETALALSMKQAHVVIGTRNPDRGQHIVEKIRVEQRDASRTVLELTFDSIAPIRAFVTDFKARFMRLDPLVNNAGVGDDDSLLTDDGFPRITGVDHLGHFAVTGLLLDTLLATPSSRVVTVVSQVHRNAKIDIHKLKSPGSNV